MEGTDKLFHDLDRIEPELERAQDEIAQDLTEGWKREIRAVGAVLSGAYVRSVDVRGATERANTRDILIDTSGDPNVTYSDIVERGRKPPVNYPGREPALRAIVAYDVRSALDTGIDRALR